MSSYSGKILRVDLTAGQVTVEMPPDHFYRKYMGGKGFAAYYLLKEMKPGVDPLSADNILVFAPSVLTGAPLAGLSRYTVAAKSPVTGGYGEAEVGGYLGPEIKFAGFDAIVVTGKSEKPVYICLQGGEASLRDASSMWGMTTGQVQDAIRKDMGEPNAKVAAIGPGGERMVRFACVIDSLRHAAGRGGMGAVMGSKNLKAVAAKGSSPVNVADPKALAAVRQWFIEHLKTNPMSFGLNKFGTAAAVASLNAGGMLPTRNFQSGVFEDAGKIDATALENTYLTGQNTCYACPVACKRQVVVPGDEAVDPAYGGPEYETIGAFGSNMGIGGLSLACRAHAFCNAQSLDTISAGMSISFAQELYERGIIDEKDTGGLALKFGDEETAWELLKMIAEKRGFGAVLAEGVKRAAEKIGRGAEAYALHVKGLELPMHEPRGKMNVGLSYATGEHGADHMVAAHDPTFGPSPSASGITSFGLLGIHTPFEPKSIGYDKVRLFYYSEQWWSALKALSTCFFCVEPRGSLPMTKYLDAVRAITGWDTSLFEVMKCGERATTLARLFNIREGFTPADDTLPQRFFTPAPHGPIEGVAIPEGQFRDAIRMLYAMRGWDPDTGKPTLAKLVELDVEWAAAV